MNTRLKNRLARISGLPIALLALSAGFASIGQAQDIPSMVITTERPSHCDSALAFGNKEIGEKIRATAASAVWQTRVDVAIDLGAKLNSRQPSFRVAGRYLDKRG
jgi:hypothetical protein